MSIFSPLAAVLLTIVVGLAIALFANRHRLRFSLRTALLLMTIVGSAIVIVQLWREVGPLRSELRRLRNEVGNLTIDDPKMIHVIRVPTEDNARNKFRLYLPAGRKYSVSYHQMNIPADGLPQSFSPHEVEPGEYLISVKVNPNYKPGTWDRIPSVNVDLDVDPTGDQKFSTYSARIGISEMHNDWIVTKETGHMAYSWTMIGRNVEKFSPSEPVILYRARAHQVIVTGRDAKGEVNSYIHKDIKEPCDGFMVWVEPVPPAGANVK